MHTPAGEHEGGDEMTNTQLRCLVAEMDDDTLRRLRAIINGKLGKREITPEQQAKMQAARKRKVI